MAGQSDKLKQKYLVSILRSVKQFFYIVILPVLKQLIYFISCFSRLVTPGDTEAAILSLTADPSRTCVSIEVMLSLNIWFTGAKILACLPPTADMNHMTGRHLDDLKR